MPKYKKSLPFKRYESRSDGARDRNNCTVVALAAIIDDYELADMILTACGRKRNKGFYFRIVAEYLNQKKYCRTSVIEFSVTKKGPDKMTPKRFVEKYKTGKYVVKVDGHVFAVIDGFIVDTGLGNFRPGGRVHYAVQFD